MRRIIRFLFNCDTWETVGSAASLVPVVAASIVGFEHLQIIVLVSGVSTTLQISGEIRRRRTERTSIRRTRPPEVANSNNVTKGSESSATGSGAEA